jgi:PLP dependent protein
MAVDINAYNSILKEVTACGAGLVAVSKTKPMSDILQLRELGQVDFGENYVQELQQKSSETDHKIRWHFIGHLQSNKAKNICGFVHLIHGADSLSTITEVGKHSVKHVRVTDVLLQVRIAREETKYGLTYDELDTFMLSLIENPIQGVRIRGLMGMATNTEDTAIISEEFRGLRRAFERLRAGSGEAEGFLFDTLSMGMTSDYKIALAEGSTLVRIGSAIFGHR